MDKLIVTFKLVVITLAGSVGAAVVILLALSLIMRGSTPYRVAEWLIVSAMIAVFIFFLGGGTLLLHAALREAHAESALRPLGDLNQTRFLVDVPLVRRYGVLDIRANAVRGVIIGRNDGQASPIAPVSYDLEAAANGRIPMPQPYPAGDLFNDLFGGR